MARDIERPRSLPIAYLFIAPAFAIVLLFSFVSMGISFYVSLHDWDGFRGAGRFVGAANYARALSAADSVFWLALGHNPESCRHEMFRVLMARGAKWAGTPQE